MILLCVNELAGPTGYHKSVVETANALQGACYPLAVLSFLGSPDGARDALPRWPLDVDIPTFVLQTLQADGGRLLHRNVYPALTGGAGATEFSFTANELAALRQLNARLSGDDTVVFTAPLQALAFHHALAGDERRPRTLLQVHGDYLHHRALWDTMLEARDVVDRVQTVASGLREQFVSTFAEEDVVYIPNVHNARPIDRVAHEGVNIVLPASFQHRKNQLDAIRALSKVDDRSVHLTLWGNINPLNPYYITVRHLVTELGLDDRVRIPGFGTEADVYATADIVLMTSLSEGFGYPLLEAAYHGLPAVTYDFDFGPRDAVEEGASGYVVPIGDVDLLAERLRSLAADACLRARLGERGREVFAERFSTPAIVARYAEVLGAPGGAPVDLVGAFAARGGEPVAADAITHCTRLTPQGRVHEVVVASPAELHDVVADDGEHRVRPSVRREAGATHLRFRGSGTQVISYTTVPGSSDRHYLATLHGNRLDVLPYLRRDADYGDGTPPVEDTLFASSGGARRIAVREVTRGLADLAARATPVLRQRLRVLLPTRCAETAPAPAPSAEPTLETVSPTATTPVAAPAPMPRRRPTPGSAPSDAAQQDSRSSLAKAAGLPTAALGSVRRVAMSYGKAATQALVQTLAVRPSAPTRRELPRHPLFPVTAGVDSFGASINSPGGVTVRNAGSPARPTVSVEGECDWLLLRDARGERRVEPPFSYGELFERLCVAEREHGLFEQTTKDGVHLWELGRSALVIQLAEAAGLWGKAQAVDGTVSDVYAGPKRLTTAPPARRVVFDYVRRGQSGYRTEGFRDDETLFVVQPERDGYPEVDDTNLVYPFHEFSRWKQQARQRWSHLRVPDVDSRPFEAALSEALGIRVDLADHLRNRLAKFLAEREFWTPVFERIQPEEVAIASSHWWAGIADAAARSGARVSDIQYALTSRYAPSFWFGARPHYGATRLYAWSDFWAQRTNVYQEHVIVPRQQAELTAPGNLGEPVWDVCVVSQPRVLRRIIAFTQRLAAERPELRIVVAPHPAQRGIMAAELTAVGLTDRVDVAAEDTISTLRRSAMCVGAFSTSLWEAAALGLPTYVIPVPGHEETLLDVESGLFRIAASPHDLMPFEVPASRSVIFGTAQDS